MHNAVQSPLKARRVFPVAHGKQLIMPGCGRSAPQLLQCEGRVRRFQMRKAMCEASNGTLASLVEGTWWVLFLKGRLLLILLGG